MGNNPAEFETLMAGEPPAPEPQFQSPIYRAGFGYDVHRLVEGRPLILGGIDVPFEKGLDGHSDADVLLHALIDAVLGAAAMGDIGTHFPSSDASFEGVSSVDLLREVMQMVGEKGWRVENIDSTIVAQGPKLSPHTPSMKAAIAEALGIEEERVNVKSKTTDGLGFTGTGEGMAAYCVVMLANEA